MNKSKSNNSNTSQMQLPLQNKTHVPHKILLLNGPPQSGKDTIAKILTQNFDCRHLKFSEPLKNALQSIFYINDESVLEKDKDNLSAHLFNKMSIRQFQIKLSEEFLKPNFGSEIFGKLFLRRINMLSSAKFTVCSDVGFTDELEVLRENYSRNNIFIVYLYRKDTSFKNDNRAYLDLDDSWNKYMIHNHGNSTKNIIKPIVNFVSNILKIKPNSSILDKPWSHDEITAINIQKG